MQHAVCSSCSRACMKDRKIAAPTLFVRLAYVVVAECEWEICSLYFPGEMPISL